MWLRMAVIQAGVGLSFVAGTYTAAPAQTSSSIAPCSKEARAGSRLCSDTAVSVSLGGFIDGYYAYDFGRPTNFDRQFTTQAARHNEFNVGLAYIDARLAGPRIRGRLALQAGTAVQSNYAGEPTIGSVSGPGLSRFLQEAVAGYEITPSLWIDAGIFFSHIGMESFISRDNLTYTRSLSSDFTPYYASGAKLTWQVSPKLAGIVAVMNGWQNISENNQDKAVGIRLDYAHSSTTTLSYYDFFGNEAASDRLRVFNGVGLKTNLTSALTVQANFDYGTQQKASRSGQSSWYSSGLVGKLQVSPALGLSARIERYHDPDQVIVVTGLPAAFDASMASAGIDVSPRNSSRLLWRSEARGTWARNPVFTDRSATSGLSRHNYLLVTSLALTF
jgi:hypothetical protein